MKKNNYCKDTIKFNLAYKLFLTYHENKNYISIKDSVYRITKDDLLGDIKIINEKISLPRANENNIKDIYIFYSRHIELINFLILYINDMCCLFLEKRKSSEMVNYLLRKKNYGSVFKEILKIFSEKNIFLTQDYQDTINSLHMQKYFTDTKINSFYKNIFLYCFHIKSVFLIAESQNKKNKIPDKRMILKTVDEIIKEEPLLKLSSEYLQKRLEDEI